MGHSASVNLEPLAVQNYIAHQPEHHRRQSFQEEFLAFLKKNRITVDERYLWD